MEPEAFPRMRWRRLDAPGREHASLERVPGGWRLDGRLRHEDDGVATTIAYRVLCDARWRTLVATVDGQVGERAVRLALTADGEGRWLGDGAPAPEVDGALDVDLGFTPSTNTLAIRRLALEIGHSAAMRAAWFRYPELRLEPLEQTYTREADHLYRFDAEVDGQLFTAQLTTDAAGWVVRY